MSALDDYIRSFPVDIQEAAWVEVNGSHGNLDSTEGAVTIARAILAERKRCAETTDKYRKDVTAGGEARLVAAYIHREIMSAT